MDNFIQIIYDLRTPHATRVITSEQEIDSVEKILNHFITNYAPWYLDKKANKIISNLALCEIIINFDAQQFHVKSNTNNKDVTCGIILTIFEQIHNVDITVCAKAPIIHTPPVSRKRP